MSTLCMIPISNKVIKILSERFEYKELSGKFENDIHNFIYAFFREDNLKKSFIRTRIEILDMCIKYKDPYELWDKVKEYLINKLESQIPIGSGRNHTGSGMDLEFVEDKDVTPFMIVDNLLNPDSYLSSCIKLVSLFNLTNPKLQLPKDVFYTIFQFPSYELRRKGIVLKAITSTNQIVEKYIKCGGLEKVSKEYKKIENEILTYLSIMEISYLDNNQQPIIITIHNNEFFKVFRELFPDIYDKHLIHPQWKPQDAISKLHDALRPGSSIYNEKKLFHEVTGYYLETYKWLHEGIKVVDHGKIKKYFPEYPEIVKLKEIEANPVYIPHNNLNNTDLLRYEVIDLYIKKLPQNLFERILSKCKNNIEFINFSSIRIPIQKQRDTTRKRYGRQREIDNNKILNKDYNKWLEYVAVAKLIQQGIKPKKVYKMIKRHENWDTTRKRYERQKKVVYESGYNLEDKSHVEEIMKTYKISELECLNLIN